MIKVTLAFNTFNLINETSDCECRPLVVVLCLLLHYLVTIPNLAVGGATSRDAFLLAKLTLAVLIDGTPIKSL